MKLTAFKNQGVSFSKEHFTEETIAWLLESPKKIALGAMPPEPAAVHQTPESAFAAAWAELSQDAEFEKAVKETNYDEERGRREFLKAISTKIDANVDKGLGASLKVGYERKVEAGTYVHLLNGERILVIPASVDSAATVSANADVIMYGCFLVIDTLSIVAAAASIKVFVRKEKLATSLQRPLWGFFQRLFNPAAARELKQLEETGKTIELVKTILAWLRGSTDLKIVIKIFVESLSLIDKVVAVVQLLAAVVLLLATAGASLAARIWGLAASITMLMADAVAFVRAMEKK